MAIENNLKCLIMKKVGGNNERTWGCEAIV